MPELEPGYRALASAIVIQALHDLDAGRRPGAGPEIVKKWASALIFLADPFGADELSQALDLPPDVLGRWLAAPTHLKKTMGRGFRSG